YVNFVSLLQGPQVFRVRPQYLPERFDVPSQRLSFRQCRFEMPSVVSPGRGPVAASVAFVVDVRRFDSKLQRDFFERQPVTVNTEGCAVSKVERLIRFLTANCTIQGPKGFRCVRLAHRHILLRSEISYP